MSSAIGNTFIEQNPDALNTYFHCCISLPANYFVFSWTGWLACVFEELWLHLQYDYKLFNVNLSHAVLFRPTWTTKERAQKAGALATCCLILLEAVSASFRCSCSLTITVRTNSMQLDTNTTHNYSCPLGFGRMFKETRWLFRNFSSKWNNSIHVLISVCAISQSRMPNINLA